jgi:hypothetical protein
VDNAAESAAIAADSSRVSTMSGGFDQFPASEARVHDHRFGTGGGASRRWVNGGREPRISAGQYVLCPSVTPDSPRSFGSWPLGHQRRPFFFLGHGIRNNQSSTIWRPVSLSRAIENVGNLSAIWRRGEGGIDSGLRPSPFRRRVRVVQNRLRRFCRTLDGLLTHTPLAGARLRPLGHLSGQEIALIAERRMIPARSSPGKAKGSNRLGQALSNVIDNLGDRSSRA